MNYLRTLSLVMILALASSMAAFAQQQKAPTGQKKVVRINPVTPDTTDPNKKALMKFSKDQMFNVTTPPKALSPAEVKAMGFYSDGSKKGKEGDFEGAIRDFTTSLNLYKHAGT